MAKDSEAPVPGVSHSTRLMAVRHDDYGWRALEAAAQREGTSLETLIADACGHFVVELRSDRIATRLPRFRDPSGHGDARELELAIPERIWDSLEAEAANQNAELPRLVEHATLLYIADLDSGRAASRIVDSEKLPD